MRSSRKHGPSPARIRSAACRVGRLDRPDVHAVHRPRRHAVGGGTEREVGLSLLAFDGGAHRVQVVLAAEQQRQPPQGGQVGALVELALGVGAVTEEAGRHRGPSPHPVGECEADGHRDAPTDDGVAAVEPVSGVEEVHRATAAPAAPGDLAEHLGHHRVHRHPAHQGVPVLAVRRDDGVGGGEGASAPRRPPPPRRCRRAGTHGSWWRCRARRTAPRTAGSGSSAAGARSGAAPRGGALPHRWFWSRTSDACSSRTLQGREVALGKSELAGLQQSPHDLPAARVRQVLVEGDVARSHRAQSPAAERDQLHA